MHMPTPPCRTKPYPLSNCYSPSLRTCWHRLDPPLCTSASMANPHHCHIPTLNRRARLASSRAQLLPDEQRMQWGLMCGGGRKGLQEYAACQGRGTCTCIRLQHGQQTCFQETPSRRNNPDSVNHKWCWSCFYQYS